MLNHPIKQVTGIDSQAKALIERFETGLQHQLATFLFSSTYNSLDDILQNKYHLSGIDGMDFPDFSSKTEFIPTAVRGNVQKAAGKILTYAEAEAIVEKGLQEELP